MIANRKLRRKKADDTTATMRRFVMLQLIPWEPGSITTTDLHQKLEAAGYTVETRTIQRDLTELMGPFHYSSELRGRTLHWFWPRHCRPLSIREINPATALALNLAEHHLRHLLPNSALELLQSYFDQARQTLSSQDPKKFGRWTERVRVISRGPTFAPPKIRKEVQTAVFDALLSERQIRARYRGRNQAAAKDTVLHPLGVVNRDGVIYLVATAWGYSDAYQYALHRIEHAEVGGEASTRPKDFDLDRYIDTAQEFSYPIGNGPIALKLEIEADAAISLLERPLSADQNARQLRDGRYRIEATVEDTADLRWWLLGFGPNLRVLGPRQLREDIGRALSKAAAHYTPKTAEQDASCP